MGGNLFIFIKFLLRSRIIYKNSENLKKIKFFVGKITFYLFL